MTDTAAAASTRPDWVPVVVTITLVQAVLAFMTRTLPLFGMPLTQAGGVPPEAVGQLASATSFGSMVFFLWGPALFIRLGPMRQLQIGCLTAGLAMISALTGQWQLMLVSAFIIGLGYGPAAPAGSDLLMRVTPQRRRATIFSVKQAGVPLGGLAAGLLLPFVATLLGTAAALVTAALVAGGAVIGLALVRGKVDDSPPDRPRPTLSTLVTAPIRLIGLLLAAPQLRLVTLAGLSLGVSQGIVFGFYPVFLSDHAGWGLAAAGAAFALLQGLGVPGRVAMGWLADRIGSPIRALAGLGVVSGLTMYLLATIGPGSPTIWVLALSALAGITVVSWNGVFLTGLAETAPEGRVGEITAAGTFVLFAGYVLCPLVMQAVFSATDGYATGMIAGGTLPILAGAALLMQTKAK